MKTTLKIANCRGKKPVITDLRRAQTILATILFEINPCYGKKKLREAELILCRVLRDNDE